MIGWLVMKKHSAVARGDTCYWDDILTRYCLFEIDNGIFVMTYDVWGLL